MNAGFDPALAHVLQSEGGYVNNRHDPGGATNQGVTQREYNAWRAHHGQPPRDVRLLQASERDAIYREDYWNPVRGDDLPGGVDYATFDFCVNSGPVEAVKCLQRAVEAADDGHLGSLTLAAVKAADPRRVVHTLCAERLAFMKQHCDWADFGDGWEKRVNSVEMTARGMA